MSKIGKNIITIIYGIGSAIVIILLALVVFQSHVVIFPNVMLPMELRELATVWLMLGFLPMLIFSILFYKVHDISKSNHKIRNTILTYMPTAICLICVIFWLCIMAIGIINTTAKLKLM